MTIQPALPQKSLLGRDKAVAEGVPLDYREYDGMVHDWMLGPLPEAKQAIKEIVETIRATDFHG